VPRSAPPLVAVLALALASPLAGAVIPPVPLRTPPPLVAAGSSLLAAAWYRPRLNAVVHLVPLGWIASSAIGLLLLGHGDLPFAAFVDEHEAAAGRLARLRELADQYVVPAQACNTWRALWAGLEALEATMHAHVDRVSNVKIPRADAT